ncbi:hypothetical protein HBB16_05625 [Pseudonocardia sp. MCCB 268]|nr:hypothetical protein [Pseudonocardia cytotoxica]
MTPEQRAVLAMRDVRLRVRRDRRDDRQNLGGLSPARGVGEARRSRRPATTGFRPAERRRLADASSAAQHGDLRCSRPCWQRMPDSSDGGRAGAVSRPVHGRGPGVDAGRQSDVADGRRRHPGRATGGAEPAALLIDPEGHLIGVWSLVLAETPGAGGARGWSPDKLPGHPGLAADDPDRGDWRGR